MSEPSSLVSGTDFVTVPTEDFDRAVEFYGTVLGLPNPVRYGQMPGAEFETGNLTLAVMQSESFGFDFAPNANPIALHVDDVEEARASSSRGASASPRRRWTAASATWLSSRTPTATR